jgi:PfaD family protein
MLKADNSLSFMSSSVESNKFWTGPVSSIVFDEEGIRACLLQLERPCFAVRVDNRIGFSNEGELTTDGSSGIELLAALPPQPARSWGNPEFNELFGLTYAYVGGSMAQGISSEELVIALGKAGMLGSFGAAGLSPARIEAAIKRIQAELPTEPYAFNLIHSPSEESIERRAVELYLQYGVGIVEASAFLDLTPHIVRYRAAGLSQDAAGNIQIKNRVIAKLSRREVAAKFMQPAPERILRDLVEAGQITAEQAALAAKVPGADYITVEADSGGHTDNRPLVCLLPSLMDLRDEIQDKYGYARPVGVGAAGGIGTPAATLAAFMMGADYVVTGSANSACVEAGTSEHTKKLLAQAEMPDVMMAPSADMFEMGVKVQLLKRGTLFPLRSQKLYDLYRAYDSIEQIPAAELAIVEKQYFRKSANEVWAETVKFFQERDPEQLAKAEENPKRKMGLIFRWYLGLSSRWSNTGEKGREMDYQIWCGPAMGAFNDWVRGTYLEQPQNRKAVDVGMHLLTGAAYLNRLQALKMAGLQLPISFKRYRPEAGKFNAIG